MVIVLTWFWVILKNYFSSSSSSWHGHIKDVELAGKILVGEQTWISHKLSCRLLFHFLRDKIEAWGQYPPPVTISLGKKAIHIELESKPATSLCSIHHGVAKRTWFLFSFWLSYIPQPFWFWKEYFTPMKEIVLSPRKAVPFSTETSLPKTNCLASKFCACFGH